MSPKISVIVPIYKVEAYLEDCVNSLLSQTFKDFELILINDGSPDNCGVMIDAYAEEDARIVAIHQENAGLSAARNTGIEHAKGEYLTFVDSDDWVHPTYLETLHRLTEEHQASLAVVSLHPTKQLTFSLGSQNSSSILMTTQDAIEGLYGEHHLTMSVACGKLYHKDLFATLRFEEGKLHEDEFFNYLAYDKAQRIAFTSLQLYFYRLRPDSITGVGFHVKASLDAIEALLKRLEYLEAKGLKELEALTYPVLFERISLLYHHRQKLQKEDLNRFLMWYHALKPKLRQASLPKSFRVYTALHYGWPWLAFTLKRLWVRLTLKK